jgi:phosphoribosylanthranilate isomerase
MKLKVCGLMNENNIKELIDLTIDYMGFIFYKKSPRFVAEDLSFDFVRTIPKQIKKIGVFVNENSYSIFSHIAHYNLDMVQLHGDETPEICAEFKSQVKVVKAFQMKDGFDFKSLEPYIPFVDYFLFDTATVNYGGSGQTFNWQILNHYHYDIPFFLSGGIDEQHVNEINKLALPKLEAIDINSKFEMTPGLKNIPKIKKFISKLNKHDNK